jgi:ABC-type Fe3+/spermidine/putrescine transport system ATPase subunit
VSPEIPTDRSRGSLSIQSVSKSFGAVSVLENVSLEVRPGEFVTLLGPSGCGKTTLLRLSAGLEEVDSGRISISGIDVTAVGAHHRPVHTVFQSYALFPHLSVFENVAFGLRIKDRPEAEVRTRVARTLAAVHLEGFETRTPAEISGGQGQRVALARALVLEPDILLLDEPLAALDAQLRSAMRSELVLLQRSLGTTFVMVTHDLEEAIECSSRIAVMREGRIAQYAPPEEIFEHPASTYVARLVGMENIFEGRPVEEAGGRVGLDLGFTRIDGPRGRPDGATKVGLHGEHVVIRIAGGGLQGTVREARYLGETKRYEIEVAGQTLVANTPPQTVFRIGEAVSLDIAASSWVWLPE